MSMDLYIIAETQILRFYQRGIPKFLFQYTYSVGFGIAYPRKMGNAKA